MYGNEAPPAAKRHKRNWDMLYANGHRKDIEHLEAPLATPACTGLHRPCLDTAGNNPVSTTARKLESIERTLCSQSIASPSPIATQALTSCSVPSQDDDGLGFSIQCSQVYCRSQAPACSSPFEPGTVSQQHDVAPAQERGSPEPGSRRNSGADGDDKPLSSVRDGARQPSLTPELGVVDNDGDCGLGEPGISSLAGHIPSPQQTKLFSIFMPKGQRRVLHMVRHGQSEYNAASASHISWDEPQIFGPKLTKKGRADALRVRKQLLDMRGLEEALWVSSPLHRAIETLLLACPFTEAIRQAARNQASATLSRVPTVIIRSDIAEQVLSTGDIGHPASHLQEAFPELRRGMEGLAERWWYMADANDAELRRFVRAEPHLHLKERVSAFMRWVEARPEKVIVGFGHGMFIKELLKLRRVPHNGEICSMHI